MTVVWKNPGGVALYVVMGRRDAVKWEAPSHPPSCLRLGPETLGAEKVPLSFLLLGIVDCHMVIEKDQQEEHVGEDGKLHICDHADQLGSVPQSCVLNPDTTLCHSCNLRWGECPWLLPWYWCHLLGISRSCLCLLACPTCSHCQLNRSPGPEEEAPFLWSFSSLPQKAGSMAPLTQLLNGPQLFAAGLWLSSLFPLSLYHLFKHSVNIRLFLPWGLCTCCSFCLKWLSFLHPSDRLYQGSTHLSIPFLGKPLLTPSTRQSKSPPDAC